MVTLLATSVACTLATGCGSSSKASVEARSTTTGQELQDLQTAYDKGLLTEAEYQKQRKAILDQKK